MTLKEYEKIQRAGGRCWTLKKRMTVWKKLSGNRIARLTVPRGARVVVPAAWCARHRGKFRVSEARVEEIIDCKPHHPRWGKRSHARRKRFQSGENLALGDARSMSYSVNEQAIPDGFTSDPWVSCGNGIHVFPTRPIAARFEKP